jgi:ribonuclease HIII
MPQLESTTFDRLVTAVKHAVSNAGYAPESVQPMPYGRSIRITGGGMVNLYNGKKGPTSALAGNLGSAEKADISQAVADALAAFGHDGDVPELFAAKTAGGRTRAGRASKPSLSPSAAANAAARAAAASASPVIGNTMHAAGCWAGSDESGKGDFFGPLVVAAVAIEPGRLEEVAASGIRDGKDLSNGQVLRLCGWVERNLPFAKRVLLPHDYNAQYRVKKNVNVLLADMHAEVIAELCHKTGAQFALTDEFAVNAGTMIRHTLKYLGCGVKLELRPKAENDAAVAAASVLARGLFLDALRELGNLAGVELPAGAGPPVIKAGKELVHLYGTKELGRFAKLHFRTIESVVG